MSADRSAFLESAQILTFSFDLATQRLIISLVKIARVINLN